MKKRCPFCSEEILKEARKCKHCSEFLDEELKIQRNEGNQIENENTGRKKNRTLLFFIITIIGVFVIFKIKSAADARMQYIRDEINYQERS